MKLYSVDANQLKNVIRQQCMFFFRDNSINDKIANTLTRAIFETLESKSVDVERMMKWSEDTLLEIDRNQGFAEEDD